MKQLACHSRVIKEKQLGSYKKNTCILECIKQNSVPLSDAGDVDRLSEKKVK